MASTIANVSEISPRVSGPALRRSERGFFGRCLDRMKDAQARRAEETVARYIELHGGRVTDSIERQIERRFGQG